MGGGVVEASTLRASWGLLISVKSPSSLKKKKKNPKQTNLCCLWQFSFLCVCLDASHLAVDAAGGIQRTKAVDLEIPR